MEKKIIEVGKHPYMWKVEVTFGTLDEMIKNAYRKQSRNGLQVFIGGSFNEGMNDTGRRASLFELAVEIDYDTYSCKDGVLKLNGVKSASAIGYSCWEGVYWYCDYFEGELKQGLYPIKANWDGKTYIKRGKYDKNGKYVYHYELTDTFRY